MSAVRGSVMLAAQSHHLLEGRCFLAVAPVTALARKNPALRLIKHLLQMPHLACSLGRLRC
jgi:hypothetical protein